MTASTTISLTDSERCTVAGSRDLSLLTHLAAQGMRAVLDRVCRERGLNDGRDWFVLSAMSGGVKRTQLEIARLVCIDKTTLTALLDRLENLGMIVRAADSADRRARIPQCTEMGRQVCAAVARSRNEVEHSLLAGIPPGMADELFALLVRCADAGNITGCGGVQ